MVICFLNISDNANLTSVFDPGLKMVRLGKLFIIEISSDVLCDMPWYP